MQEESKDPDLVLAFYKQVIRLRKSQPALREGTYIALHERDGERAFRHAARQRWNGPGDVEFFGAAAELRL